MSKILEGLLQDMDEYVNVQIDNGRMIGFLEILADENLWRQDPNGGWMFQGCPAVIIRERAADMLGRITTIPA